MFITCLNGTLWTLRTEYFNLFPDVFLALCTVPDPELNIWGMNEQMDGWMDGWMLQITR